MMSNMHYPTWSECKHLPTDLDAQTIGKLIWSVEYSRVQSYGAYKWVNKG